MLAVIAGVCLLRALVLAPIASIQPHLINVFEVVAALIGGAAGIGFAARFLLTRRWLRALPDSLMGRQLRVSRCEVGYGRGTPYTDRKQAYWLDVLTRQEFLRHILLPLA